MSVESIRTRLENLDSIEDLRGLFVEELNFYPENIIVNPADRLSERVARPVQELRIIAKYSEFNILLCTVEKLLKSDERTIANQLISKHYFHSLIIFTDPDQLEWHFCNLKHIEKKAVEDREIEPKVRPFRRMIIGKIERLRTISEQLYNEAVVTEGDSAFDIHLKFDAAFDVEAVSKNFYSDFVYYYKNFRDALLKENQFTQIEADQFTQTIFNRLLFLYFVQKRGFLDYNPRYLYGQFTNCQNDENYYHKYLIPVFKQLSLENYSDEKLGDVPFLNGGLFEFDNDEEDLTVKNEWFETIYEELLERYNFTVREDTEFEQEVAVDPEMLGTVFEQLILGLESKEYKDIPDPRRGSGSYYTPKFIVNFMVKESLIEYLKEKIPRLPHLPLKNLVYYTRTEEFNEEQLNGIKRALLDLKAVDPGIGSGAFPVGLLLKIVEICESIDYRIDPEFTREPDYRYSLKHKLIENVIYGVDIQERAVHLAELRLWLSLLVEVPEPEPLPNLEFHIYKGDSLISKIAGEITFDLEQAIEPSSDGQRILDKFQQLKEKYEQEHEKDRKDALKNQVYSTRKEVFVWFLGQLKNEILGEGEQISFAGESEKEKREREEREAKAEYIDTLLKDIEKHTDTFNWALDFADIMTLNGGFDIVIGNPPYGVKVPAAVRDEFGLGNRDSYGVFASLAMRIVRDHGVICFIMSDTWQTIRTHKPLRDQLMEWTDVKYLISAPDDTFKATVFPGVYLFKKRTKSEYTVKGDNWIFAADLSPLDIKSGELEIGFELLSDVSLEEIDETKDGSTLYTDKDIAIFAYRQKLIPRFSNHSFFIASPKLFRLMQDVGNKKLYSYTQPKQEGFWREPEQASLLDEIEETPTYSVDFNGRELELVKLGDIAEVKQGLATGDNDYYLRQSREKIKGAAKNYRVVNFDLVLEEQELNRISNTEALRLAIIQTGIVEAVSSPKYGDITVRFKSDEVEIYDGSPEEVTDGVDPLGTFEKRTDIELPEDEAILVTPRDRYFEGKYFVLYDKGGASDIEEGWLPNYWVPTDYYIDWSERAVYRLQTLTINEKEKYYNYEWTSSASNKDKICSRFQNTDYYFLRGISYSRTGEYCPTFRIGAGCPFDTEGSLVFFTENLNSMIGEVSSTFSRYLFKNYIDHTVHLQIEDVKKLPLNINSDERIINLVRAIIDKQKRVNNYNYMINEQIKIDEIVHYKYNLQKQDKVELNNWFHRRYPRLAEAIDARLESS